MRKLHKHQTQVRGFTLGELLLVSAIITILVALLLPAIMQAREAARRTQCKNNLAQYSIAVHNYVGSFGVLPPGSVNETGPIENSESGYHMSWMVQILPFMDQHAVFLRTNFDHSAYSVINAQTRTVNMPVLHCPSDQDYDPADRPASSYAGCHGGHDVPIDVDNKGVFFLNSSIADQEIRDGASNTLLISERRLDDLPSGTDLGWVSGTAATLRHTDVAINRKFSSARGVTVAIPFDSPVPDQFRTDGFSSHHTGGAQFALVDGSVRFLSENIDPGIYQALGDRADGEMLTEY